MFQISREPNGDIKLKGRLDATAVDDAAKVLQTLTDSVNVDFKELEYIASAGLGVLFATQKRLKQAGKGLVLINLSSHIRDVFRFARFDLVFEIR